jgi:pimeloyl-ACP methyl ester carboxylesterase
MASSQRTVGDVSLDIFETGEGPPLLFLHGEDGLLFSHALIDALATSFRVFAPEHPGWGGSSRPPYVTDVADLARVYAELIESLEGPVAVVGCSFGGWVAAELAVQSRIPLGPVVLVAPTGIKIGDREERDYADIWIAAMDELPAILYGRPDRAPDLTELSDGQYLYLARAQEATARYCWVPYMHDPKLRHWLRRIAAPTAVVSGSADRFALLDGFYATYASLIGVEGAEHIVVDGAGHRLEEEEPIELARIVQEFVTAEGGAIAAVAASRGGQ